MNILNKSNLFNEKKKFKNGEIELQTSMRNFVGKTSSLSKFPSMKQSSSKCLEQTSFAISTWGGSTELTVGCPCNKVLVKWPIIPIHWLCHSSL